MILSRTQACFLHHRTSGRPGQCSSLCKVLFIRIIWRPPTVSYLRHDVYGTYDTARVISYGMHSLVLVLLYVRTHTLFQHSRAVVSAALRRRLLWSALTYGSRSILIWRRLPHSRVRTYTGQSSRALHQPGAKRQPGTLPWSGRRLIWSV